MKVSLSWLKNCISSTSSTWHFQWHSQPNRHHRLSKHIIDRSLKKRGYQFQKLEIRICLCLGSSIVLCIDITTIFLYDYIYSILHTYIDLIGIASLSPFKIMGMIVWWKSWKFSIRKFILMTEQWFLTSVHKYTGVPWTVHRCSVGVWEKVIY